jgi:hypothetical protein
VIPAGGLPAWTTPDAALPPDARLDAGLPVQLLQHHETGWARIACSNGWIAWVDGRYLAAR